MTDPARFWNKMARRYAKTPISDQAAYEYKLQQTRERLTPEMRLLELGCGTGTTALIHAPYVREIVATDFSDEMITIGREKAEAEGITNVRFEVEDAAAAGQAEASFDGVLAMSLLHLVPNPPETIERIRELLKPGGLFISTTPCLADMGLGIRLLVPVMRAVGMAPPVSKFTQETLQGWLADAGFTLEHTWTQGKGRHVFLIARAPA